MFVCSEIAGLTFYQAPYKTDLLFRHDIKIRPGPRVRAVSIDSWRNTTMSRGKLKFKQQDISRAIRAVRAAGVEIGQIEIAPDGRIVIRPGKPAQSDGDAGQNEWDEVA
jgi:hypothetical protein